MVRLAWGWQRGVIGKVLAEQSLRGGSEGQVQNLAQVPGTGAEQRGVGGGGGRVDNTTVVDT